MLIIVSNREPYSIEKTKKGIQCKKSPGGLVSGLDKVMQSKGGLWIAQGSGENFKDGEIINLPLDKPKYRVKRIKLSEIEIDKYYRGFSNGALWPLFHLFPERARFNEDDWDYYKKINEKFAGYVLKETSKNDLIWIHDYHLGLLPKILRNKNRKLKVGFFWHIPWVSWDIFSKMPWREEFFEGLLGSDLIGFHTEYYVKEFIECANRIGFPGIIRKGAKEGLIRKNGRNIKIKTIPIGVDYNYYRKILTKESYKLKKSVYAEKIILGVDRLDYSKGILNRILAFERLLYNYPNWRGKVTFIQIANPSRTKVEEYRQLKKKIDENIGRVNGKFQKMDWIPIRYLYRMVSQERLLAFYQAADVALVTPLKDGMNLVCKEYIAANKEGILILSEFAGSSEQLKDAIIVNPNNIEEMADAMKYALEMPLKERKR